MITSTTDVQTPNTASPASSQLGQLLEDYGEIAAILPVLSGLFVTTQFRLRGASALVVNIAIAAITRQVIVQLKKQAGYPPTTLTSAPPEATEPSQSENEEEYTIVHSVPGRIRLKVPRLHTDEAFAKAIEKRLLTQDIVLGVRVNRSASSIAIRYDGSHLTELELGMRLLQLLEQAEQDAVVAS